MLGGTSSTTGTGGEVLIEGGASAAGGSGGGVTLQGGSVGSGSSYGVITLKDGNGDTVAVTATSATVSTSKTTGALVVTGGIGSSEQVTSDTLLVDSTSVLTGHVTFGGDIVEDANEAKGIFAGNTGMVTIGGGHLNLGAASSTTTVDGALVVDEASTLTGNVVLGSNAAAFTFTRPVDADGAGAATSITAQSAIQSGGGNTAGGQLLLQGGAGGDSTGAGVKCRCWAGRARQQGPGAKC